MTSWGACVEEGLSGAEGSEGALSRVGRGVTSSWIFKD